LLKDGVFDNKPNILKLYTHAQPRVGNSTLGDYFKQRLIDIKGEHVRMVYKYDPVALFPKVNRYHTGIEVWFSDDSDSKVDTKVCKMPQNDMS
jgi:hypothetical protein